MGTDNPLESPDDQGACGARWRRSTNGGLVRFYSCVRRLSVRNRSIFVRAVATVTLLSFVVTSCGGKSSPPARVPVASPISDRVLVQTKDLPPGLDMRVSQGKQGAPAFDHSKLAAAKRISDADAEALLSRARPIKAEADDQQSFALRPGSAPPPRTGTVIKG